MSVLSTVHPSPNPWFVPWGRRGATPAAEAAAEVAPEGSPMLRNIPVAPPAASRSVKGVKGMNQATECSCLRLPASPLATGHGRHGGGEK